MKTIKPYSSTCLGIINMIKVWLQRAGVYMIVNTKNNLASDNAIKEKLPVWLK